MKAIVIVAAVLVQALLAIDRSALAESSPVEVGTALPKIISEVDPDLQRKLALSYLSEAPWKESPEGPADQELLTLLRNPRTGYLQGKKLAAILTAATYGIPREHRHPSPIVDKTADLSSSWRSASGLLDVLGALQYARQLCCHQDNTWKDVLFVYWREKVHEIPNNSVWDISLLERRYFLIKVYVHGYSTYPGAPELEDAVELWILDSETNTLSKALHLALYRGAPQSSYHTFPYGVTQSEVGDNFQPVNIYYREDTGERTEAVSHLYGNSYNPNSPYFIFESYAFDHSSMSYKQVMRKKLEGVDYLKALSDLSNAEGRVRSGAGEQDVRQLFTEFLEYSKNGASVLGKSIPLLKPVVQKAAADALAGKRPKTVHEDETSPVHPVKAPRAVPRKQKDGR